MAAASAHSNSIPTVPAKHTKAPAQVPAVPATATPTPASSTLWTPNVCTFKAHGTKLDTQQDLFVAINSGKLVFIDEINNIYIDVINWKKDKLSRIRLDSIPKPTVLKKDAFDSLVKSTRKK